MSRLEIILSAVVLLSLGFNVVVYLYARATVTRLLLIAEELGDLQDIIDAFAKHVKSVYELEMFYGDVTLEHLLNHAVSFNEQLETFDYIYNLTREEEDVDIEDAEEVIESEEEEDAPTIS